MKRASLNVEPVPPDRIPLERASRGPHTPYPTPFHQPAFLEVLEYHSGAELHLLVGHDEFGPVGMFPIFECTVGPVTTAFSPPPGMGMYQLGPMLFGNEGFDPTLDRVRREARNRRFVDACLVWISETVAPSYLHVRTHPAFTDPRPFRWNGFELHSRFTYSVDLDRPADELLMAFSSDARRNVRECEDACTVEVGGVDAIEWTLARVEERYAAQGKSFSVDPAFVADLYESLPEGQVRPYVCEVDGERRGGMITFEFADTIYRWQGGVKPDTELPVNDFLDWTIMEDARERGVERYDLVGANTARLCEYKAKFDPVLVHYCTAVGGTRLMRAVAQFVGNGVLGEKLKPLA